MTEARVVLGDCREVLPTLEAESFAAVVTDPPAGIESDPSCFAICERRLEHARRQLAQPLFDQTPTP